MCCDSPSNQISCTGLKASINTLVALESDKFSFNKEINCDTTPTVQHGECSVGHVTGCYRLHQLLTKFSKCCYLQNGIAWKRKLTSPGRFKCSSYTKCYPWIFTLHITTYSTIQGYNADLYDKKLHYKHRGSVTPCMLGLSR